MGMGARRTAIGFFVLALAVSAGVAAVARTLISHRFPLADADWWKPAATGAPLLDPETLARAANERLGLAAELAERRMRIVPVPERLRGGTAVTQIAHGGPVLSAAWLGADAITGGADGTLRWWRPTPPGPRLLVAIGMGGAVERLAANAKTGHVAAFVLPDRLVELRGDLLSDERVHYVVGGRVGGLAFADAGSHLVALVERPRSHGPRWTVLHFETSDLLPLKETNIAPTVAAESAELAPDGTSVAVEGVGPAGGTVELFRADDGAPIGSYPSGSDWKAAAGWSGPCSSPPGAAPGVRACDDTGSRSVFGAPDGSVRIDSPDGSGTTCGGKPVLAAALARDGRQVRAWVRGTEVRIASLDLRSFAVTSAAAEGTLVAVDAESGGNATFDAGTMTVRDGSGSVVTAVSVPAAPDAAALRDDVLAYTVRDGEGTDLAVAGASGTGRRSLPGWLGHDGLGLGIGPHGDTIVVTGPGGFAAYRSGEDEPILFFPSDAYAGAVSDVAPTGDRLTLGLWNGEIETWGIASGECEKKYAAFRAAAGAVTAIRYRNDGEMLLVGSSRGALLAFHGRTGNAFWTSLPHHAAVGSVVFSRSSEHVFSFAGAEAALGAAATGAALVAWTVATPDSSLAAAPDGFHLAIGAWAGGLAGLRVARPRGDPRGRGFDVIGAADPDFARMGSAVDALRVTLILAGEDSANR